MNIRKLLKILVVGLLMGVVTDLLVRQACLGLNYLLFISLWTVICLVFAVRRRQLSWLQVAYVFTALGNALLVYLRASTLVQFWAIIIGLTSLTLLASSVFIINFRQLPLLNRWQALFNSYFNTATKDFWALLKVLKPASLHRYRLPKSTLLVLGLVSIFGVLFATADQVIGHSLAWTFPLWRSVGNLLADVNTDHIITVLFWIFCSTIGLLMLSSNVLASTTSHHLVKHYWRPSEVYTTLGTLISLFLIFDIVQLRYLFAGGQLPDNLTYATYARQGYGQLLIATLLAAAVTVYLIRNERKSVVKTGRYLATFLTALNLLVVVSAWQRLRLYETAYGMTMTRLVARLGLISMTLGSLLLLAWIWQFITTRQLYGGSCWTVALVLTLAAVLNPEALVARQNITSRSQRDTPLDAKFLLNLSPDAWPAICRYAPDIRHSHAKEYSELRTSFNPTPPLNHGLSQHYTHTKNYLLAAKGCLR